MEVCLQSNTAAHMASTEALVGTEEGDGAKLPEKATCVKCGCPNDDFESHSLQCRQCWNVHQILYRHLGGAPSSLQSMQPDEQKKFFKDVGGQMKITPKNGRWALVRAAMVKCMTHYRKEERVNSVKRKYLPLSVLERKGYDLDAIKAHGDRREDEVAELVYNSVMSALKLYCCIPLLAVCPLVCSIQNSSACMFPSIFFSSLAQSLTELASAVWPLHVTS